MLLAIISCDNGNNPGDGTFVAVTGITGVPTTCTVGTPLTLTGTVTPANATNKTFVWTIVPTGTATVTGAVISGNTLTATGSGDITIRATIANGTAQGTAFTQDFPITIAAAGNHGGDSNLNGTWMIGDMDGYTFNNSNFVCILGGEDRERGIYTISGNNITMTVTEVFISTTDTSGGWKNKSQVATEFPDQFTQSELDEWFSTDTYPYTLNGNTLTLTWPNGYTGTYTKR